MGNDARIIVRPIGDEDAADWRALWTAYLDFYDATVSDEVYASTFARIRDDAVWDYHGLIAEHDGRAVGLVHFLYHRHGWKIENVCYLQDLFAAPEARGLGVGRALIEAVYAAADKAGAPSVYWLTQEFNTTARRLYDRIGVLTPFIKYQRA